MFWNYIFLDYILPGGILLAGVVDDLRSRKIHNWLVLILLTVAVFCVLFFDGLSGIFPALGKMVVAVGVTVPLVLMKVIGGGDMKLYAVLALILPPSRVFLTLLCAFFGVLS